MVGQCRTTMCLLCPKTSSDPRRLARSFSANSKLEPERTGVLKPACPLSTDHGNLASQPLQRTHVLHLQMALWRREVERKKGCRLAQY